MSIKGSARAIVIWLFCMVIIFVIVLGYTTMSRVMTGGMWEDVKNISDVNESSDASSVISTNEGVWQFFPYVALLAIILWAIFASGG